ncbi:type IV pilus modification protein PilV [Pseudomonas indica]|uniref:type IV pilus modification protein PilV n=1 Tax=Pseudomonas indica TaxID=137658 RepID=UPI000BAB8295|nr:type IV pilus modification protein PilV [Pseudomonas indica]PAU55673.1 type IV pilus modification protein PilV [Pseudomonas indica]
MPSRNTMKGFSLIEILISMLVLGIGILGMVGLQLNAMKVNQTASVRSQATFLAYDIVDRMRANTPAALAGSYDIALTAAASTGTSIADQDIRTWKAALSSQLPAGTGAISRSGQTLRVIVQWDESKVGGQGAQQFTFETRLCEKNCL